MLTVVHDAGGSVFRRAHNARCADRIAAAICHGAKHSVGGAGIRIKAHGKFQSISPWERSRIKHAP